eukprot:1027277_1
MAVTKQADYAHLYINSVHIGSISHTYATGETDTQNIMIGSWNDYDRYFTGDIDEVRIYDRALNQTEIDAVYTYYGEDLTKGLIAHFDFNNNSHSPIWPYTAVDHSFDLSGNGNTAYNWDATETVDRFGECCAMHFDGDSKMRVPYPNNFPALMDGERTMTAWFRQDSSGVVVSIGSDHKTGPDNKQFAFHTWNYLLGGSDANAFPFDDYYPTTDEWTDYSSTEWYHMAVTKQADYAHLYINSVHIGSISHTYATGETDTQNIMIGSWNDYDRYFTGDIDEVRIYDRALNQTEIDAVYTYYGEDLTKGLIAHFDFNNQSDSPWYKDLSGNGNWVRNSGATQTMDRNDECCAMHFDGSSYMQLLYPTNFPALLDEERTMTAWFRPDGGGIIVAIGSKHQFTPYNEQFAFNANNMLYGGGNANDFTFPNAYSYSSTEWYHMAVTKQADYAHLYINSVHIGSISHTYATGETDTQNIMIGSWNDYDRYFTGDIDEVRIYDRALNQTEIDAVYTYYGEDLTKGLIAHFDF